MNALVYSTNFNHEFSSQVLSNLLFSSTASQPSILPLDFIAFHSSPSFSLFSFSLSFRNFWKIFSLFVLFAVLSRIFLEEPDLFSFQPSNQCVCLFVWVYHQFCPSLSLSSLSLLSSLSRLIHFQNVTGFRCAVKRSSIPIYFFATKGSTLTDSDYEQPEGERKEEFSWRHFPSPSHSPSLILPLSFSLSLGVS